MNIIAWLCSLLGCRDANPPLLPSLTQRDRAWTDAVLAPLKVKRLLLDSSILVCSEEDFRSVVMWDWVDSLPYKSTFDCDDFAMLFKARVAMRFGINVALVIDYISGHAYNLVLLGDGKPMIL